jgi:hypothetical protein
MYARFYYFLACPKRHPSRPMWKDVTPGSVEVDSGLVENLAPGLAENVAPGSVEVAPGSVEVAPRLAEDVAPGSEEDARLNPALNSVVVSAGDLLSTDCQWLTTRLVENVLLLGAEERRRG